MTEIATNAYCVILAGGKGRRLWPVSRELHPKQFLDILGTGRTLIQQTYDRMSCIFPKERIYINTNRLYLPLIKEQLPHLADEQLIAEPIHRNTVPSAVWAIHRIRHTDSTADATVLFTPADLAIKDEATFGKEVQRALDFARKSQKIVAVSVKPTRAEPGYGYIQVGEECEEDIYTVQSFTEKPERELAQVLVDSGEFYWNTGLFAGTASKMWDYFGTKLPQELRRFDEQHPQWSTEEENVFMNDHFPLYPNLPMDLTLLEQCEDVCVMTCRFDWADIGTWHSIYEALQSTEGQNVALGSELMAEEAQGNLVKLAGGRMAVLHGLEDFIVVEQDNVLFICKKEDSSALVRKYINDIRMHKGEDYV